jgi:hypothetical protein
MQLPCRAAAALRSADDQTNGQQYAGLNDEPNAKQ